MSTLLSMLLYYFLVPMICFCFFCRCCSIPFKWYWVIAYTGLAFVLTKFAETTQLWGAVLVFLEILLLFFCGMPLAKCKKIQILTVSALTISVLCVSSGIAQSLGYLVAANLNAKAVFILEFIDIGINGLIVILLVFSFQFVLKCFYGRMDELHNSTFLLLAIPVLFISLVEQTIATTIYGNTVIWDIEKGLISPIVNSAEMLILQIFACVGLFSALLVFQRLKHSIQNEQTIKYLDQQRHELKNYVQEAQARYEQTHAFRHDVKNHLLVVGKLLKDNNVEEAYAYLSTLERISDDLSFPSNTGNITVDALLSSKLAIAKQRNIQVDCLIKIPKSCCVKDIDWCVVLSNAIDNAINASSFIPAEKRYILISGKLKGNFYFMHIENRCKEMSELPIAGTGLSNIKAMVKRYGGTVDIEICEDVFKLNMLLIISQQ